MTRVDVLFAAVLLVACGRGENNSSRPLAASSPVPRARSIGELEARAEKRPPLVVLALDGADWAMLDPLVAADRMPELEALLASGRRFTLETEHPPLSPLLWTTIVTGVPPLSHRILDFSRFRPVSGEREPIGSEEREAPAIWNLATWAGKKSVVVGLWATHPAEPVDGLLVSDRLFSVLNVEAAPQPGSVFPEERRAEAEAALARVTRAVDLAALQRYLPDLTAEELTRVGAGRAYDHPVSALSRILVETRVHDEIARSALASIRPDFALVYIQGTDSIGHVFAPFAPPRQATVSDGDFRRYSGVAARYFEEVDGLLGRYRAWAEAERATLAVVSDHGFHWHEGRPERLSSVDNSTAAKWHRREGIGLFVSFAPDGPEIAPGTVEPQPAPIARLAATFAALSGIPPGRDLAGPPLVGSALPGEPVDYARLFAAERARRTRLDSAAPDASEDLASLRALGYLGSAEPDRAPESLRATGSTRTGGSWNNEGLILKSLGQGAAAAAAFEQALTLDPNLPSALWNLSDLLFEQGERGRSDELLVRAFAAGFVDAERQTIQRALADHRAGEAARAEALLDRALAARGDSRGLHLFRGRFRVERRDCAGALDDFRAAAALTPDDPAAHASAGIALLCLGRPEEALASLKRSLALDPAQPPVAAYVERLERGEL